MDDYIMVYLADEKPDPNQAGAGLASSNINPT